MLVMIAYLVLLVMVLNFYDGENSLFSMEMDDDENQLESAAKVQPRLDPFGVIMA